jgi:hypothetical protein
MENKRTTFVGVLASILVVAADANVGPPFRSHRSLNLIPRR